MTIRREEVKITFRQTERTGVSEWFVRNAARQMLGERDEDGWLVVESRLLEPRTILLTIEKVEDDKD